MLELVRTLQVQKPETRMKLIHRWLPQTNASVAENVVTCTDVADLSDTTCAHKKCFGNISNSQIKLQKNMSDKPCCTRKQNPQVSLMFEGVVVAAANFDFLLLDINAMQLLLN